MSVYQYLAKDKNGYSVTGVLEAPSESGITDILHKKELLVVSVKEVKKKQAKSKGKKVKPEDLVIFSRQLATMVDTGIPLVQALGILGEQVESPNLKSVLMMVRLDIEAGTSFCGALGKHTGVFSDFFINMVKAGEASGTLSEVLDRLAADLEKSAALARKVKASLVYPAVVVSMAVIITAILLLKVVPTFKGIFETLGGALPLPTRILIGLSDSLRKHFLLSIGILVLLGLLLKKYAGTEKGSYSIDKQKLKVIVLGPIFRKIAIAKFARIFSTLVKSGVPILNALEIVAKTSGNKAVEEVVLDCGKAVRDGEPIAQPLSKSRVFPPMVCRMIGIGEQTGKLEKMLSKIADFYESEVDAAVSGLTSMIEPLVIAFLGIIIGGIVISLFMPIFKITELISK